MLRNIKADFCLEGKIKNDSEGIDFFVEMW